MRSAVVWAIGAGASACAMGSRPTVCAVGARATGTEFPAAAWGGGMRGRGGGCCMWGGT